MGISKPWGIFVSGDLSDYYDPWQINYGKIYGVMDVSWLDASDCTAPNSRVWQAPETLAVVKLQDEFFALSGARQKASC